MRADSAPSHHWRVIGKWALYALYILTLVIVFAYVLFPSERFSEYLSDRLRAAAPGSSLTIVGLSPVFPLGLAAQALELTHLNREVFRITDVRVACRVVDLLRRRLSADIDATVYGGRIRGRIAAVPVDGNLRLTAIAELAGIDLGHAPQIRQWTGHALAGKLSGTVRLGGGDRPGGPTASNLTITEAVIDPPAPVMTVSRLRFDRMAAEVILDQRMLSVLTGSYHGPQLDGRIAGTISLRRPFGASRLALEGWARPHTEFLATLDGALIASAEDRKALGENGFVFRFGGTYDQPDVILAPGNPQ